MIYSACWYSELLFPIVILHSITWVKFWSNCPLALHACENAMLYVSNTLLMWLSAYFKSQSVQETLKAWYGTPSAWQKYTFKSYISKSEQHFGWYTLTSSSSSRELQKSFNSILIISTLPPNAAASSAVLPSCARERIQVYYPSIIHWVRACASVRMCRCMCCGWLGACYSIVISF